MEDETQYIKYVPCKASGKEYRSQQEYDFALREILNKIELGTQYYEQSALFKSLITSLMTGIVDEYHIISEMQKVIISQNRLIQDLVLGGQNMDSFGRYIGK